MEIHDAIERSVRKFVDSAECSLDYLTEDDMRCRLFSILQEVIPERVGRRPVSIHSEVRWYGDKLDNRRPLKYRSDIVIIDNTTLREGSFFFKAPSKGYGFNEYYGIIELKLRRHNGGSDNELLRKMKSDIEKLKSIGEYTSPLHSPVFYLIVFDKRKNIQPAIPEDSDVCIQYKYFVTSDDVQGQNTNNSMVSMNAENI